MPTWSSTRKQLEEDFLCEALRGRVQYFLTHYAGAPDREGRFAVRVDGVERLQANNYAYYTLGYAATENHLKREEGVPMREWTNRGTLYEEENARIENMVQAQSVADGHPAVYDVTRAITEYMNAPIAQSLVSPDPLVRMFAYLDRRVGKRTLTELVNTLPVLPEWLAFFLRLRLTAEGIDPT